MPSLRIVSVRTMNQYGQNATLFDPVRDALALTLDLTASADLLSLPAPSWSAAFQIIHPHTNTVVLEQGWSGTFQWGPWFWISFGNNWGPPTDYTTIERWGLHWLGPGLQGIFGFRGIVKTYSFPGGGEGLQTVDAFDVSSIRWFRAKEIAKL